MSDINITNNFNAPIGQHIDHVDTVNLQMDGDGQFHFGMVERVNDALNDNEGRKTNNENLPEVLANSELWERVKDEGLVNENNMPTTSRPEAALLAYMLAEKLGIGNKWKLFEKLWDRKNMRNDYNTALEQRKSLKFQEKLKNILG
jgi:hypothetical protein